MSHDFARSHRLKKESARKPARKKSGGVPSWLWVLVGTLVGCLIMFLVYLSGVAPPRSGFQPLQQSAPAPVEAEKKAAEPVAPPKRVSPVFEFYTKLPGGGQPVTDVAPPVPATEQPTAVTAPAAQAAPAADPIQQLLAEKEAAQKAALANSPAKPEQPAPVDPSALKPEAAKPVPKPELAKPEPKPEPKAVAKPTASGSYLQAGVFRNKAEVDKLKAKIALLGYKPTVQTLQNAKGETLQKVVVGPFGSGADMDDAKIILGGNGINAIPVK